MQDHFNQLFVVNSSFNFLYTLHVFTPYGSVCAPLDKALMPTVPSLRMKLLMTAIVTSRYSLCSLLLFHDLDQISIDLCNLHRYLNIEVVTSTKWYPPTFSFCTMATTTLYLLPTPASATIRSLPAVNQIYGTSTRPSTPLIIGVLTFEIFDYVFTVKSPFALPVGHADRPYVPYLGTEFFSLDQAASVPFPDDKPVHSIIKPFPLPYSVLKRRFVPYNRTVPCSTLLNPYYVQVHQSNYSRKPDLDCRFGCQYPHHYHSERRTYPTLAPLLPEIHHPSVYPPVTPAYLYSQYQCLSPVYSTLKYHRDAPRLPRSPSWTFMSFAPKKAQFPYVQLALPGPYQWAPCPPLYCKHLLYDDSNYAVDLVAPVWPHPYVTIRDKLLTIAHSMLKKAFPIFSRSSLAPLSFTSSCSTSVLASPYFNATVQSGRSFNRKRANKPFGQAARFKNIVKTLPALQPTAPTFVPTSPQLYSKPWHEPTPTPPPEIIHDPDLIPPPRLPYSIPPDQLEAMRAGVAPIKYYPARCDSCLFSKEVKVYGPRSVEGSRCIVCGVNVNICEAWPYKYCLSYLNSLFESQSRLPPPPDPYSRPTTWVDDMLAAPTPDPVIVTHPLPPSPNIEDVPLDLSFDSDDDFPSSSPPPGFEPKEEEYVLESWEDYIRSSDSEITTQSFTPTSITSPPPVPSSLYTDLHPYHNPPLPLTPDFSKKSIARAEFQYSRSSKRLKDLPDPTSRKTYVKDSLVHHAPRPKKSRSVFNRSSRDNEKLLANSGVVGYVQAKNSVKRNQSITDSRAHFLQQVSLIAQKPIAEQPSHYTQLYHQYEDLDLSGDLWLVREAINFALTPEQVGLPLVTFNRLCKLLRKMSSRDVTTQGVTEDILEWMSTKLTAFRDSAKKTHDDISTNVASVISKLKAIPQDYAKKLAINSITDKMKDFWDNHGSFIKLTIYIPLASFLLWYSYPDPVHLTSYTLLFSFLLGPEIIAIISKLRAQPTSVPDLTQIPKMEKDISEIPTSILVPDPPVVFYDADPPNPATMPLPSKEEKNTVTTQDGNIIDSLVSVVAGFFGYDVDTRGASAMLSDAVKVMSISNGAINFLRNFTNLITSCLTWIISKVTSLALNVPVLASLMSTDSDYAMAHQVLTRGVSTDTYDIQFCQTAIKWHSDLLTKSANAHRVGNDRLKSHFTTLYNMTYKFIEAFRTAALGNKSRIEPTVIMLMGAPGIGKSTIANALMANLFPKIYDRPFHEGDVYTMPVNTESKFYDGYIAQKVVMMEERFADTSTLAITSTLHTLLHLVSGNAMPAEQASLPLKGTIFFVPDFVIACENHIDVSAGTIANKDAIPRRFKHVVQLTAPQGGQILKTDTEAELFVKLKSYIFTQIKMTFDVDDKGQGINSNFTFALTNVSYSFDQFADLIADTYRSSHGMYNRLQNVFQQIGDESTAQVLAKKLSAPATVTTQGLYENIKLLAPWPGLSDKLTAALEKKGFSLSIDAQKDCHDTALNCLDDLFSTAKVTEESVAALIGSIAQNGAIRDDFLRRAGSYTDPSFLKRRLANLRNQANRAWRFIKTTFSEIAEMLVSLLPWIRLVVICIVAGTATYLVTRAIQTFFPAVVSLEIKHDEQGYAARAPERHHPGLNVKGPFGRQGRPTTTPAVVVSQGGLHPQALSIAEGKIFPNMVTVTAITNDPVYGDIPVETTGLFLDNVTLQVPAHLVNMAFSLEYRNRSYLSISSGFSNGPPFIIHCNQACIAFHQPNPNHDLVVLRFAIPYPSMHLITKHFLPEKQLQHLNLQEAVLLLRSNKGAFSMMHLHHISHETATAVLPYSDDVVSTVNAIRYTAPTVKGDCGGLIAHTDPRCHGLVMGMHIAGDNISTGYAVPITREDVEAWVKLPRPRDAMPDLGTASELPYTPLTAEQRSSLPTTVQGLTVLGRTNPGHVIYCPTKTSITPSLLAPFYFSGKAPANLAAFKDANGVTQLPSWYAMDYSKAKTYHYTGTPKTATAYPLLNEMYAHSNYELPFWSIDTALNGNDMVPAVDVSTSKGDYRLPEGLPKSHYLPRSPVTGRLELHPLLASDIEKELELLASDDLYPLHITTSLPKDETLDLPKVEIKRTRQVYPENLPSHVIDRAVFGPLVSHMKRLRFRAPSLIGISPADWWRLEQEFHDVRPIGSDVKKNDIGAQGDESFGAIRWVLYWCWLFDPDPRRHRIRFKRLISIHYILTDYFGYTIAIQILMSGSFLTSVLNSIRQLIHKSAGFVYFCPAHIPPTFSNLHDLWRLFVYSDDGYQAEDLTICSQEDLISFIKETFNMDYELDKDWSSFGPCFLKRSTFVYRGIVLAPLALASIVGSLCWVSNSISITVATRDNAVSALRELAHYGEETFLESLEDINRNLAILGLVPVSMNWLEVIKDQIPSNTRPGIDVKLPPPPLLVRDGASLIPNASCQGRSSCCAKLITLPFRTVLSGCSDKNWISDLLSPVTTPVTDSLPIVAHESPIPVVVSTEPTVHHDLNKLNPYPPTTLESILTEREYQLAQSTWPTGSAANTDLITLLIPDIFFTFTQIRERCRGWQLLRTDAQIRVEVAMPPALYGKLLISHLPCTDPANTYRSTTLRQKSWANPVTIDGSNPSTGVIDVNFMAERPWQDVPSIGTVEKGVTGMLKVTVLHALKAVSASAPSSVIVTVYGRLKNLHLSGYDPTVVSPEPEAILASMKRARVNASVQGRTKTVAPSPQVPEAEKQAKTGVLSGISETVGSIAPLLSPLPVVGPIAAAVGGVASLLTPLFKTFGLEKPDSVVTPSLVIQDTGYEFPQVSGSNTGIKMTARKDAYLCTPKGIIGPGECNPSLLDFCRKPGLYQTFSFTSATAADSLLFNLPVISNDIQPAQVGATECHDPIPIDIPSKCFAFWRGSIKYKISFCTSKFVACAIRVVLCQGSNAPANIAAFGGDIPGKVVQINGSVDVPVMVGFNFNDPIAETGTWSQTSSDWQATQPAAAVPAQLCCYLTSAVTSTDNTVVPTVYIAVWKAAGEDYQLFHPIGKKSVPIWSAVNPSVDLPKGKVEKSPLKFTPSIFTMDAKPVNSVVQSVICDDFKSTFPALLPTTRVVEEGLISSEECTGVADIFRRWQLFTSGTASSSAHTSATPTWLPARWREQAGSNVQTWMTQDYLASCFLGYRGGMRWASLAQTDEKYLLKSSSPDGDTFLAGYSYGAPRITTYPYAGRLLYEPILPTVVWADLTSTGFGVAGTARLPRRGYFNFSAEQNVSTAFSIWSACADDGVFATILPPPLIKALQV